MRITTITEIGEELEFDTDYDGNDKPYSINDFIEFLSARRDSGATHIKLVGKDINDEDIECDYIHIQPVLIKEESDEDYDIRTKIEGYNKFNMDKAAENNRRAMYETLKAEFE